MEKAKRTVTARLIQKYAAHLREQERSAATIGKYTHNLTALASFLNGAPATKEAFIRSETSDDHRSSLNGKWSVNTVGRLAVPRRRDNVPIRKTSNYKGDGYRFTSETRKFKIVLCGGATRPTVSS